MEQIRASGAGVIATGNPGCILQLRSGARRANLQIQILHPIQILDEG
jgi:Fe-S oxidoreductase